MLSSEPLSGKFRRLLLQGFSEHEIYAFMFDSQTFRHLAQEIGHNKSKIDYINRLIEFCEERLPDHGPYVELSDWARESNPSRYRSIFG